MAITALKTQVIYHQCAIKSEVILTLSCSEIYTTLGIITRETRPFVDATLCESKTSTDIWTLHLEHIVSYKMVCSQLRTHSASMMPFFYLVNYIIW